MESTDLLFHYDHRHGHGDCWNLMKRLVCLETKTNFVLVPKHIIYSVVSVISYLLKSTFHTTWLSVTIEFGIRGGKEFLSYLAVP